MQGRAGESRLIEMNMGKSAWKARLLHVGSKVSSFLQNCCRALIWSLCLHDCNNEIQDVPSCLKRAQHMGIAVSLFGNIPDLLQVVIV